MERRPLRNQPFSMLWKVLFLVVMELGIRNDLVDPDTGTPHEENEEEEELAQDPEIPPDDFGDWETYTNGGSGSDDHGSDPPGGANEPEAELNPSKDDTSSKPCGPPDEDRVGSSKTGENGMLMIGKNYEESGAELVDETDILYDPFDRPPGEVVIQVWPRSRSRSPRRSLSV